jgi:long-chain acyl-CoA synthetase
MVDENGELSIIDRVNDLIIVSGFNVHPAEIERVIVTHDAVELVAVVAEPDELTGEHPVAHVVLRPGATASEDELIEFCRDHLARYKAPKAVVFAASIPTGLGGKLRRSALGPVTGGGPT